MDTAACGYRERLGRACVPFRVYFMAPWTGLKCNEPTPAELER